MKIQILQCDNKKWTLVGSLIKLFQGTDYSHYGIGYTSHTGEYIVLDATSKNVSIQTFVTYSKHYEVKREYTIELLCNYEEFSLWYEKLIGVRYGYMQLVDILFHTRYFGAGIICNELVLRLFRRFTQYEDNAIDTRDLNYTEEIVKGLSKWMD